MWADFILTMFEINYGFRTMKIPPSLRTGQLYPEKAYSRFCGIHEDFMLLRFSRTVYHLLPHDSLIKICSLWWSDSSLGRKPGHKKLMLHVDNVSVHTAGMASYFCNNNSLQRVPQPPYSSDIIPRTFIFLGKWKASWLVILL
jgi:hypothetical protein